MAATAYSPTDLTKPLPEYELARQKAQMSSNVQKQTNQDALTREYSRLGNLNSGSYIKQTQLANDQSDQNANSSLNDINAQEAAAKRQLEQVHQAQAYQTSERLGGQEFQTGLLGQQQKFSTGERLGSQDYGATQSALQRAFQTQQQTQSETFTGSQNTQAQKAAASLQKESLGQQASQFEKSYGLEKSAQEFGQRTTLEQLDLATQQFNQDTRSTEFNKLNAAASQPDYKIQGSSLLNIYQDPNSSPETKAAAAQFLKGLGLEAWDLPTSSSSPTYKPMPTAAAPKTRAIRGVNVPL